MFKFKIASLSFLLVVVFSCKTKKQTSQTTPKELIQPKVETSNKAERFIQTLLVKKNVSESFWFESVAEYKDGKQDAELSVEVMAVKDQFIFMNVKALGFVNVARVMIQPDSIRILDLIHRTYISASYNYLKNFTSAPLKFENLQNLAWANAMFDPTIDSKIDSSNNQFSLITQVGSAFQQAVYNSILQTQSLRLTESGKAETMNIAFKKFKEVDALRYPMEIVINIQGEKKMDCTFTISKFALIKKSPQFVVPRSYKVMVY